MAEALKVNQTLTSVKYADAHPISYCQQPLTPPLDPCLQPPFQLTEGEGSGAHGGSVEDELNALGAEVRCAFRPLSYCQQPLTALAFLS